ncbi:MAG: hypothetical protein M1816_004326 [Peltula sp. TS41687]|nr:MAG: hypothetical protein M1816_004326 [Peltula sp. TS41687]
MASSPTGNPDTAMTGTDEGEKRRDAATNGKSVPPKITFQFCRECSNLLYPKEDPDENRLIYSCRTCAFTEPAQSACILRNAFSQSVGETAGVTQDVGLDPTVGLSNFCTLCGQVLSCATCGDGISEVKELLLSPEESGTDTDDLDDSDLSIQSRGGEEEEEEGEGGDQRRRRTERIFC